MNISKSMRGSDTVISYEKKLPRRRLLGAAGMGLLAAAMLGGTTAGLMAKVPGLGEIGFEILREGSPMGRHSIAFEERGESGFGYDPVFLDEKSSRTFAQLSSAQKNSISHRGRAVRALREQLPAFLNSLQQRN